MNALLKMQNNWERGKQRPLRISINVIKAEKAQETELLDSMVRAWEPPRD